MNNVFVLPCRVNGLLLNMIFDTGADDVSLSLTDALFMIKNGYLKESDIEGKESYKTASGEIAEGTKVNIRKITFAGLELTNIEATIMPNDNAPLLLGQSAIRKLGKILLDPENNTLTVFKGNGRYDYSHEETPGTYAAAPNTRSFEEARTYGAAKKTNEGTTLAQVMKLAIDRPGGANGANIAWNPVLKRYYAAQAGNEVFPLEVFDMHGNRVSSSTLETMFDVRGFWYNPNTKTMQVNGYNDFGWAEYKLDNNGMPVAARKLSVAASQPDAQSAGAYDSKDNMLLFFDFSSISLEGHSMKTGATEKNIPLYLGIKNKNDYDETVQNNIKSYYNENAIVYTGIQHAEVGLLNYADKQIELYNIETGLMTKVLKLPEDAPVQASLNFSYCNGIFWLFDKTSRVWYGYK